MNRRQALLKATLTTSDVGTGLLDAQQSTAFLRKLKENTSLANEMRQEIRTNDQGEFNKIATGARIIRGAPENADDGYRAGATFDVASYSTRKLRLPWEVTEDVFHGNIEGQRLEQTLTDEMTQQFALDLEDLEINGDTAAGAGPDQPFLTINDGILKQVAAGPAGRQIDGAAINSGDFSKDHLFEALYAMPNIYRRQGNLRWIISPARKVQWWEMLSELPTAAGDAALLGGSGGAISSPLGIPFLEVPALPDNVILLANPRNFVRVVSWQIRKKKVTGETDATLAALDKRFYIFFLKHDVIVEEPDAVVRIFGVNGV
jgi:hypothetical protein